MKLCLDKFMNHKKNKLLKKYTKPRSPNVILLKTFACFEFKTSEQVSLLPDPHK